MQCHNCGKENANGAKFCKYCGTSLPEKQEAAKIQGVEYEAVEPNRSSAESKGKPEGDRKEEKAEAKKGKTSPIVLISAAVSLVV